MTYRSQSSKILLKLLNAHSFISVSYTHLDVYKRQVIAFPRHKSDKHIFAETYLAVACRRAVSYNVAFFNPLAPIYNRALIYARTDVYKRQIYAIPAPPVQCCPFSRGEPLSVLPQRRSGRIFCPYILFSYIFRSGTPSPL